MNRWLTFLSLSFAVCTAVACKGNSEPVIDAPAATIDSSTPMIDAAPQPDDCMAYCACMPTNCPGFFADDAACMAACTALAPADQACRRYHCSVAVGANATMHCPHAEGMAICH